MFALSFSSFQVLFTLLDKDILLEIAQLCFMYFFFISFLNGYIAQPIFFFLIF